MSEADARTVVDRLADRGFNVDPEAASLLAAADDPGAAIEATLAAVAADALKITAADVPDAWTGSSGSTYPTDSSGNRQTAEGSDAGVPPETEGSARGMFVHADEDVTRQSTGTGEYADFVALFRDRYERLSTQLRGRVSHRSARSLQAARGGVDVAMVGLVSDLRSTRNGHRLIELEDPTGTFPVLALSDRDLDAVDELLHDEVIAVEGTLSDDGGIVFAESIHFPDVPRTHAPNTASRPVQAALVSDVHVGSEEFLLDAWEAFAAWLHSDEAESVEYLLIAGDMVEGVGVYPGQDEDLAIVDVYEQYERFSEVLKAVPGDLEIVMIPGNHDAVRLAEPQPAPDDEIASILSPHDARLVGNPGTITIESVRILLYHGASFDEIIARLPGEEIGYAHPEQVMARLLRKRHLAPPYGGGIRIAPEERDYLVIEEVPDVFHAGHVHTVGVGDYHGVRLVNSGCWQAQTAFQRRNNLDPDPGYAPIIDLDTLDVTLRKFH